VNSWREGTNFWIALAIEASTIIASVRKFRIVPHAKEFILTPSPQSFRKAGVWTAQRVEIDSDYVSNLENTKISESTIQVLNG
jgi:hypothetical protein